VVTLPFTGCAIQHYLIVTSYSKFQPTLLILRRKVANQNVFKSKDYFLLAASFFGSAPNATAASFQTIDSKIQAVNY